MLTGWNDLTKEVQLPADIMMAVSSGRKELLTVAARGMTKEEVQGLLTLVGVLLDTNYELQEHSRELAKRLKELRDNFKGFDTALDRCCDYANFRTDNLRSRDKEDEE